jgi:hypothetical protein
MDNNHAIKSEIRSYVVSSEAGLKTSHVVHAVFFTCYDCIKNDNRIQLTRYSGSLFFLAFFAERHIILPFCFLTAVKKRFYAATRYLSNLFHCDKRAAVIRMRRKEVEFT